MPTERSRPCLFCPSCNRRLWELDLAGGFHARAWAESWHALDVYHTLDLADASSSGESRPGPQAVTPPSVFHPREPSVRCWRPSRSIQTTGQLLPSSPEASQCSRASRSDFQNLTPTTSPCLPTPGRRCLILTGNVLRAGCRRLSTAHAHRAGPTTTFYASQLARMTPAAGKEGMPQAAWARLGDQNRTFSAQNLVIFAHTGLVWVPLCTVLGARGGRVKWISGD